MALKNLIPMLKAGNIEAESGNARSTIFYFYPADVARLCAQVIARGYNPTALKVTVYGMREFSLSDADGQWLSCAQNKEGKLQ